MTKNIVCAVDDSEASQHAAAVAAELSKATGADLTLLAVNPVMGGYGRGGITAYVWTDQDVARILDNATKAAKKAGAANAKAEAVKSRDVPWAIVNYAEDHNADHIVVGSGGKGGVSRLMLGSVSHDVVSRAHCPVTVAR